MSSLGSKDPASGVSSRNRVGPNGLPVGSEKGFKGKGAGARRRGRMMRWNAWKFSVRRLGAWLARALKGSRGERPHHGPGEQRSGAECVVTMAGKRETNAAPSPDGSHRL